MCSTLIVVAFLCITWIIAHHRCSEVDCGFDFFGRPTAIACSIILVVAEFLYVRRIVQLENEIQQLKDREGEISQNFRNTNDNDDSNSERELPTYSATCSRSDIIV